MWKVPRKYKTTCYNIKTDAPMYSRTIEAINPDEAEARAYLNCVLANHHRTDVRVTVNR